MTKDFYIYLDDILETIETIQSVLKKHKKDKRDFLSSIEFQDTIIRRVAIIGEAISHIPIPLRERYPSIQWKGIIAMRNILVHDYSGIDLQKLWNIVTKELGYLKKQILRIKKDLEKS